MAKRTPIDIPATSDDYQTELPLPKDGIGSLAYWQSEISAAADRRKREIPEWKRDLERTYRPTDRAAGSPGAGTEIAEGIRVPSDFYNVEQKKGQMFFKLPYVQAIPTREATEQDPRPALAPAIQYALNTELGLRGANALSAVQKTIGDCLAVSGIGAVEVGYEADYLKREVDTGAVDPMTGEPVMVPALDEAGQPQTDPVTGAPVMRNQFKVIEEVIWDRYFFDHFSPARLLQPVGLSANNYDDAPWLGREFDQDPDAMAAMFPGLNKDALGTFPVEDSLAPSADKDRKGTTSRGIVIYYRARLFDHDAPREQYRRLVIVSLRKQGGYAAVIHENCKYQEFDDVGRLISGMKGNPIHPVSIRDVTDTAYPFSDTRMNRSVSDAMSEGLTVMMRQRKRNIPVRGVNVARVGKATVKRLEQGDWQAIIPFRGAIQDTDFKELAQASFPPENFSFQNVLERVSAKTWGFETDSQLGIGGGGETATAASLADQNKDIRISTDRDRFLGWYVRAVYKFAALMQRFGRAERFYVIEGPDGAKKLEAWTHESIAGQYLFEIKPDSSQRINAAETREIELKFNNLTGNNPHFNQVRNARDLATAFNKDPAQLVQQPPPPSPPEPSISFSIKGEDLNPASPQYPNVLAILQGKGVNALAAPAADPITAVEPVAPVDKHQSDLTGKNDGPALPTAR